MMDLRLAVIAILMNVSESAKMDSVEVWSNWQSWSACSVTCGFGIMKRERFCKNSPSPACRKTDSRACILKSCNEPDGTRKLRDALTHSKWGSWSRCSASCGIGITRRSRMCLNVNYSPRKCLLQQSRSCRGGRCAPQKKSMTTNWKSWSPWTACSASCGGGQRTRTRTCQRQNMETKCVHTETDPHCNDIRCPTRRATWGSWSYWSKCTKTCGRGLKIRKRVCNNMAMSSSRCPGRMEQVFSCESSNPCPKDNWTSWGDWTKCSKSCGNGTKIRKRACPGGMPSRGNCLGLDEENTSCLLKECVKESWTSWGEWSQCSLSCGSGTAIRKRACKGGETNRGNCPGANEESAPCNQKKCVQGSEPVWTEWGSWSACAKSCGPSWKSRTRVCLNNGDFSFNCIGHPVIYDKCFIDCSATEPWGPWGLCSATCNSGVRTRTRKCRSGPRCKKGKQKQTDPKPCNPGKCIDYSKCGQAGDERNILLEEVVGRVVRGSDAANAAWPWQVMIANKYDNVKESYKSLVGGGSIINNKWILTASHIIRSDLRRIIMILGMTKIPEMDERTPDHIRIVEPARMMRHPKSVPNDFDYDAALLEIGKRIIIDEKGRIVGKEDFKLSFSEQIRPVCLPCLSHYGGKPGQFVNGVRLRKPTNPPCSGRKLLRPGNKVVVTGYGDQNPILTHGDKPQLPPILQQGLLKLLDNNGCAKGRRVIKRVSAWADAKFTSRMLCANSAMKRPVVDACRGDSGGPLTKMVSTPKGGRYWVQVGIVSWGLGCAHQRPNNYTIPGYFTNVFSIRQWLLKTMST
ncbi:A disintegrin and metalloproteinase with thrombospondin motifs adt-1-like isoform X2 [Styela clava]